MTTIPAPGADLATDERAQVDAAFKKWFLSEEWVPGGDSTSFEFGWRAALTAVPASEPVYFVKSLIHPNGWHECDAADIEGHERAGFTTRTLYAATLPVTPAPTEQAGELPPLPERLEKLRALALAAEGVKFTTEGFEQSFGTGEFYGGLIMHENGHTIIAQQVMQPWGDFIAAANPAEILDLVAALAARQVLAADFGEAFEKWARTSDGNCSSQDLRTNVRGEYVSDLVQRDFEVWQASALAARQAPTALPIPILAGEMAALRRFHECALDGEGYDIDGAMMSRLAQIGLLVRPKASRTYYEPTDFGQFVLNGDFVGQAPDSRDAAPKERVGYWFPEYGQAFISETMPAGAEPIFAIVAQEKAK